MDSLLSPLAGEWRASGLEYFSKLCATTLNNENAIWEQSKMELQTIAPDDRYGNHNLWVSMVLTHLSRKVRVWTIPNLQPIFHDAMAAPWFMSACSSICAAQSHLKCIWYISNSKGFPTILTKFLYYLGSYTIRKQSTNRWASSAAAECYLRAYLLSYL